MSSEFFENKQTYIEELGVVLEGFGMTRITARVLSALLVADPPRADRRTARRDAPGEPGSHQWWHHDVGNDGAH